MRLIVTGVDEQNRSAVVREEVIGTGAESAQSTPLWATADPVPQVERPPTGPAFDPRCPPGTTAWRLFELPPGTDVGLHRTNTLDFDLVLAGHPVLVLQAGEVALEPGDAVVLSDVLHGWRTGDEPMVASVMLSGLEPQAPQP